MFFVGLSIVLRCWYNQYSGVIGRCSCCRFLCAFSALPMRFAFLRLGRRLTVGVVRFARLCICNWRGIRRCCNCCCDHRCCCWWWCCCNRCRCRRRCCCCSSRWCSLTASCPWHINRSIGTAFTSCRRRRCCCWGVRLSTKERSKTEIIIINGEGNEVTRLAHDRISTVSLEVYTQFMIYS